jgi:hypothetical protein
MLEEDNASKTERGYEKCFVRRRRFAFLLHEDVVEEDKSVLFYEDVLFFCFHEDVVEEDEKCFVLRRCSLFSICGNATRDGTHHFERGGDVTPG